MKKHLIAAAVAAAVAGPTLAQVTISGTIDQSYISAKKYGTGSQSTGVVAGSLRSSNHVRFTTAEDLGGGLKAHLFLEQDMQDSDTGTFQTAAFARGSFVGVSGGFGTINVGKPNSTFASAIGTFNNFSGNVGGLWTNSALTSRPDNSVQFISPTFNGVNLNVVHSVGGETGVAATKDNGKQTQASLQGTIGKFSFIVGTIEQKTAESTAATAARFYLSNGTAGFGAIYDSNTTGLRSGPNATAVTDYTIVSGTGTAVTGTLVVDMIANGTAAVSTSGKVKHDGLGISYDFGMAQVTYNMVNGKITSTNLTTNATTESAKYRSQGIHANVPFGGSYSAFTSYRTYDDRRAGQTGTNDHKAFTVGVQHNLSKRTNVYALYDRVTNESASTVGNFANTAARATGAVGEDPSMIAVGIRHSF